MNMPSSQDLRAIYDIKYRNGRVGWGPRMRLRFGYFTPDDYYEALISKLVTTGCEWADLGCGRHLIPTNLPLAEQLSRTAGYVVGIDPDRNIRENHFLTEKFEGRVEDYRTEREFDVVTMRNVAEHIENPSVVIDRLAALARRGRGSVVILTPEKWAPLSILARFTPLGIHHLVKRWLWLTEERDTFPVRFRMNTRRALRRHFEAKGFREAFFTSTASLSLRRMLRGSRSRVLAVRAHILPLPHREFLQPCACHLQN
jgi:hypothetical protein